MGNPLIGLRDGVYGFLMGNQPKRPAFNDPLMEEMVGRAKEQVERKILPDKAGDATPVVLRAMGKVRKAYPADMVGVKAKDMSMANPQAFSNIMGSTDSGAMKMFDENNLLAKPDYEMIKINPAYSAVLPDQNMENIVAHELQHVRQNRTMEPAEQMRQHENYKYNDRPIEKEAYRAGNKYSLEKGRPQREPSGLEQILIQSLGKLF